MRKIDKIRKRSLVSIFFSNIGSYFQVDQVLFSLISVLLVYGMLVLYSVDGSDMVFVKKQLFSVGLGLVCMFITANIKLEFYKVFYRYIYLGFLALLVFVLIFGKEVNGSVRWIDLYFITFQPSELGKIIMPIVLISYLMSHNLPPTNKEVLNSLGLVGVACFLVYLQPDLGTALVIFTSSFVVLFLVGLDFRWIISGVAGLLLSFPLIWKYGLHEYQKNRILTMFFPENDPLGTGWNIMQSKIAIGSGGLFGKGWMSGSQSKLQFLPEAHTDFIFSVLAEELGFVGFLGLLALFVALVGRCFYLVFQLVHDNYDRLVILVVAFNVFLNVSVNILMVSGWLPVVGMPLPFISYGGTSLLMFFISFGILMSAYRSTVFFKNQ